MKRKLDSIILNSENLVFEKTIKLNYILDVFTYRLKRGFVIIKWTSLSTVFSYQFIAGAKSPEECLLVTLAKGISNKFASLLW